MQQVHYVCVFICNYYVSNFLGLCLINILIYTNLPNPFANAVGRVFFICTVYTVLNMGMLAFDFRSITEAFYRFKIPFVQIFFLNFFKHSLDFFSLLNLYVVRNWFNVWYSFTYVIQRVRLDLQPNVRRWTLLRLSSENSSPNDLSSNFQQKFVKRFLFKLNNFLVLSSFLGLSDYKIRSMVVPNSLTK